MSFQKYFILIIIFDINYDIFLHLYIKIMII